MERSPWIPDDIPTDNQLVPLVNAAYNLYSGVGDMFTPGKLQAKPAPAIPPSPAGPAIPPVAGQVQNTAQAAQDKVRQDRIRAAKPQKTTTMKEDMASGDTELTEEFATDGGKITIKRKKNKYQEAFDQANAYTQEQQQYHAMLRQAMQPRERQTNLAPVMGFIDQFTGSNLRQQYQDPNAVDPEMQQRLRAAAQLAKLSTEPRDRAYKRMMDMANLDLQRGRLQQQRQEAKDRAKKEKEPKRLFLAKSIADLYEDKAVQQRATMTALSLKDIAPKIKKGVSKIKELEDLNLPADADEIIYNYALAKSPLEVRAQRAALMQSYINRMRRMKNEDGSRKWIDEDIRDRLYLINNKLETKLRTLKERLEGMSDE